MLLCYTLQQIEPFRSLGEEFVVQHADTKYMGELEEDEMRGGDLPLVWTSNLVRAGIWYTISA